MNANEVTLQGQEAHHALHVVRLQQGQAVELFNGQGAAWEALVRHTSRKEVILDLQRQCAHPESGLPLVLAPAWIQRDKALEELIRRGTELGVAEFRFFEAGRSGRPPKLNDKMRQWAIDSCKQCGRNDLPRFESAACMRSICEDHAGTLLIATPSPSAMPLREAALKTPVCCIIGPEGDFTEDEVQAALDHGAVPVSLGPLTYRAEVAAIIMATLIQYERGELGP